MISSRRIAYGLIAGTVFVLSGMFSDLSQAQVKPMKIEFSSLPGCPNAPKVWAALLSAAKKLEKNVQIDTLNIIELSPRETMRLLTVSRAQNAN